jgi:cell division protein FtsL
MIRLGTVLWLAVVASVGFITFTVKREVQELEEQLAKVNREITTDRDEIHVLKADWSFLTQPNRLADLARRHLTLQPIGTAQLGAVEQLQGLPMRPDPQAVAAIVANLAPPAAAPAPAKPRTVR